MGIYRSYGFCKKNDYSTGGSTSNPVKLSNIITFPYSICTSITCLWLLVAWFISTGQKIVFHLHLLINHAHELPLQLQTNESKSTGYIFNHDEQIGKEIIWALKFEQCLQYLRWQSLSFYVIFLKSTAFFQSFVFAQLHSCVLRASVDCHVSSDMGYPVSAGFPV